MLEEIFDIDKFNVYSDNDYYYFFRALNKDDNNDIDTNITTDSNNKIERVRTNRERYNGVPKYSESSVLTLEEAVDHINTRHRKDTNCISLTSNANTAIMYGRGHYKDKYIVVKVPKKDIGNTTYEAGLYMLKEVTDFLNKEIKGTNLEKVYERIDACKSSEELKVIEEELQKSKLLKSNYKASDEEKSDLFQDGIKEKVINSDNYIALNDEQNLEKDKVVLKVNLYGKRILPKTGNNYLIKTIGNAFSSLELVHYKDIKQEEIIETKKELIDIFGLLQQMPNNLEYLDEIKSILLENIDSIKYTGDYTYKDFNIEDKELSIENLYKITGGRISYKDAIDLYKNAYYLSKSKLRTKRSVEVLNRLLGKNLKYQKTLNYILKNGYGIEPEITVRKSKDLVNVSESVSINISPRKERLVSYINSLDSNHLMYVLDSPNKAIEMLMSKFLERKEKVPKEEWIADAMIDLLDLDRLGIEFNLRQSQREDIKKALIKNNVSNVYFYLKRQNVKEKDIANVLFTNIIKKKDAIDLDDTFTIEELEDFIGYNKVEGTGIVLKDFQRPIVDRIKNKFKDKNFTSLVLPTSTGKSYIALTEMHDFEKTINKLNSDNHARILYLAPNEEILNQLKSIIRETYNPEKHLNDKDEDADIKRIFPNLVLGTYQDLKDRTDNKNNLKEIYRNKYDLIIFDEIHRTGAQEWLNLIEELIDNQDRTTKVLGMTATPERDMDFRDMTEFWARKFGYTDDEILKKEHLSSNLDLIEAIQSGILMNFDVINCAYTYQNQLEELKFSIDEINDEKLKDEGLKKYEKLRRKVSSSVGIERILNENIKSDDKYIVFLPVTKKCEDEDGNTEYYDENGKNINQSAARRMIEDYQTLFSQFLYSDEYLKNNPGIEKLYRKIINNNNLDEVERNYLESEKENILLLSKYEMKYKNESLISKNDILADKIINYMGWKKLSNKKLKEKLHEEMKDKVENISMLGSYGSKANRDFLNKFNEPTNGKPKLMFVMNKLNEGVHAKGISGIVWLRPMDTNSRILFLQQLGRCMKYNDKENLMNEKKPKVIDLVNNVLNVKLVRNHDLEESDIIKLTIIKDWIEDKGRIPNGNSKDKFERNIAKNIIFIKNRYSKYIENKDLLKEDMKYEKAIVDMCCDLDIWNIEVDFSKEENLNKVVEDEQEDSLSGILQLDPVTREFLELRNEVENYNSNNFEETFNYYYGLLVKIQKQNESGICEEYSTNLTSIDKIKIDSEGIVHVVKYGSPEYKSPDLLNVGDWLYNHQNRRQPIFDEKQKQLLREVGYVLQEDKLTIEEEFNKTFNYYYGLLVKIKEQNESGICEEYSTNLTSEDKIKIDSEGIVHVVKKNSPEYKSPDLLCVGRCLHDHQNKKQPIFDENQKQLLREVGYVLQEDKLTIEEEFNNFFNKHYSLLVKIKEQNESGICEEYSTNLASDDKIKIDSEGIVHVVKYSSPEYNSPDLLNVGQWLYIHQNRRQPFFDENQKQMLREVGYVLQEDKLTLEEEFNKTFNDYYGLLVKINEQNESGICEEYSTNLTSEDKIKIDSEGIVYVVKKNSPEYNSPNLLNVGEWFYSHQNRVQPIFNESQKKMLRKVGYILQEDKLTPEEKFNKTFNEYYSLLVKIKEQNESGICEEYSTNLANSDKIKVDSKGIVHVVKKSSPEYNFPDLLNVGQWLYKHQNSVQPVFDETQKQMLREVGYVLQEDKLTIEEEFNKTFNDYYGLLVKINEQNESGICEEYSTNLATTDKIKIDSEGIVHVVKKNSSEYKSLDLLNVGLWLYNHQSSYQPIFDEIQKQMLREVGYVFQEDKLTPEEEFNKIFNDYYGLLVKIKEQNESGICEEYSTNLTNKDKIKVDSEGIVHVVKKSSSEYKSPDLVNAGQWLYNHQNKVKPIFDENQKQLLREVGYVLQEDKNKKFNEFKKKVDSLHHDNVIEMVEYKKEAINVNRVS